MTKKSGTVPQFVFEEVKEPAVEGFGALMLLFNGAPYIPVSKGDGMKAPVDGAGNEITRDKFPWYAAVPVLGVQFMLRYADGSPVTGRLDFNEADQKVVQFLDQLSADPERFEAFRAVREWGDQYTGYKAQVRNVILPYRLQDFVLD